jgi:hypothetical protein
MCNMTPLQPCCAVWERLMGHPVATLLRLHGQNMQHLTTSQRTSWTHRRLLLIRIWSMPMRALLVVCRKGARSFLLPQIASPWSLRLSRSLCHRHREL